MSEGLKLETDYAGIYASFDGTTPGCLGKDCPNSCCAEKTILDCNGQPFTFKTSLLLEEYWYQVQLDRGERRLESLGVHLRIIQDIKGATSFCVQNCLDPERGCKLAGIGRKPIICRVSPMGFGPFYRENDKCPALQEIQRQGGEALKRIIEELDSKSGFTAGRFAEFQAARKRMR